MPTSTDRESTAPRLTARNIRVAYGTAARLPTVVVNGVDLELRRGRIFGLGGESGSGKSTTALALVGFPPPGSAFVEGRSQLGNVDILSLPYGERRSLWGSRVALVSQGSGGALNPARTVGFQLAEVLKLHMGLDRGALRGRGKEVLESVRIPDPDAALRKFPHQFSGGQQQRIALGLAICCEPEVLVLDEPSSGLDVTTQKEINELIVELVRELGVAALYISHDLPMLAEVCHDIGIMYAGEIVEWGPGISVFADPRHPYTAALLDAVPSMTEQELVVGIPGLPPGHAIDGRCSFVDRCRFAEERCSATHPDLVAVSPERLARCLRVEELGSIPSERRPVERNRGKRSNEPLLTVRSLSCEYRTPLMTVLAVDDVALELRPGETLAIVGESGSGKSTLLRCLAGLHPSNTGEIWFDGNPVPRVAAKRSLELARTIQIIFQNADTSLNPRKTVAQILERPLVLYEPTLDRPDRFVRMRDLLSEVRLDASLLDRRPRELSGGQRQRVAVARAFAASPRVLLADEIVSALDVSVAASVLEVLVSVLEKQSASMLFVTHNMSLVPSVADRIAVMKDGVFLEVFDIDELFDPSRHQYTKRLLEAVPDPISH